MSVMVPYVSPRPLRGTRALAGGRLGALGTSPIVGTVATNAATIGAGTVTGSLIGTAAGTTGGALFGAAAGSVVPIIGTVVGAIVGILTSKLFGHANYGAVYANIANVARLFQAYSQVAGQYVGRNYGWPELQYIWHGAMVSGLFPGNGPPAGQACTQAMISHKINACGTGQWIDDLLGSSRPTSPGTNNIAELIAGGIARGIADPVTMTSQVLVPGMEAIAARRGNAWISVARSANPALYTQLLEDTADYMMSVVNPNLPAYYGSQNIVPVPSAASAPAASAPAPGYVQPTYAPPGYVPPAPSAQPAPTYTAPPAPTVSVPMPAPAVSVPMPAPVPSAPVPTAAPPAPIITSTGATIVPPASIAIAPTPAAVANAGGTIAPVDATAAYLAQLQQQGATANQAMLAAIAQLQSQGLTAQAAQSTVSAAAPYASIPPSIAAPVTPQANPVGTVNTAGVSGASSGLILAGLAVLSVIFASARPHKFKTLGKRRRKSR